MISLLKKLLFTPPSTAGEQELKFSVPGHLGDSFQSWLRTQFQPHPDHGVCTVCSIYFDTWDLASHGEKASSDYFKTKYRIRWYTSPEGVPLQTPAYLEIKEKEGVARQKYRARLPYSPQQLASTPLTDPFFQGIFQRHLPPEGCLPHGILRPILEIRYLRHRYVHSLFPEAFCLDSQIRSVRGHEGILPMNCLRTLSHDVFEQKGPSMHPLPVLHALPRFGARRASISKYYLIIQELLPYSILE